MYVITKFEIPLSEYEFINTGTKLEVILDWDEYDGFIAVKYLEKNLYFAIEYFEDVTSLVQMV